MRSFLRITRTLLIVAILATPLYARIIPAAKTAAPIPDAQVIDEFGSRTTVRSMLGTMGSGSVVLLPVYTRCSASCPLQTQKLKRALAGLNSASVRVLVFSFDPGETAATLAEYRKRESIPAGWRVIRADESAARGFFDFFHYSVFNEKGQMIHPDQIFLLDPSLHWQFTMAGLNWDLQELGGALSETRSPGIVMWARTHPDALAWAGLFSIAFGVGLLCVWLVRRRPDTASVAART